MPTDPAATLARAQSLLARRRPVEAVAALRALADQYRDHAGFHALLGTALRRAGDGAAALDCFEAACRVAPDNADYWIGLGLCRRVTGDDAAALAAYRRATELAPDHAAAQCNLGNVLLERGQTGDALACFEIALALQPRLVEAWVGAVRAHGADLRLREAPASFLAALARLTPQTIGSDARHLYVLGSACLQLGWSDAALAYLESAFGLAPDNDTIAFGLALCCLGRGDFGRGWALFERREQNTLAAIAGEFPEVASPRLDTLAGAAGRHVLVLPEQGFGDRIQFARYLPLLASVAAGVTFVADRDLLPLMRVSGIATVAQDDPLPAHDAHCLIMSFPYLFGTTLDTVPAQVPYLHPPQAALERWRARLPADARLRVGINWAGNPAHPQDRYRSIPLASLAPLLAAPRTTFYSLQKYAEHDPAHSAGLAALGIVDLNAEIRDFADAAGLIGNLDLVITADTATAHLAGAIGRPVWTVLPSVPDYRWLADRDDTPWYPTMRLFRQRAPLAWADPVAAVCAALEVERSRLQPA